MKWLRRLLYRRIVKGFKHRMESLENLMDTCQKQMMLLGERKDQLKDEATSLDAKVAKHSLSLVEEEYERWSRIYWDAYNRHEEVESGLTWVLKDFYRR